MIGVHQVKVTRLILKVVCLVSSPGGADAPLVMKEVRQKLPILQSDGTDEEADLAAATAAVEEAVAGALRQANEEVEEEEEGGKEEEWTVSALQLEIGVRIVQVRNTHVATALKYALEQAGSDDVDPTSVEASVDGFGAGEGIGGTATARLLGGVNRLLRRPNKEFSQTTATTTTTTTSSSSSSSSTSSASSLSRLSVDIVRVPPPPPPGSHWGVGHPARGWEATYSTTMTTAAPTATAGVMTLSSLVSTNPLNHWLPTAYDSKLLKFNDQVEKLRNGLKLFCPQCVFDKIGGGDNDDDDDKNNNDPEDVFRFEDETTLVSHMKEHCPAVLEAERVLEQRYEDKVAEPGRPLAGHEYIMCYLSGRRLVPNRTSFSFHLRACVRAWQLAELAKPKGQRRLPPRLPKGIRLPPSLDFAAVAKTAEERFVSELLASRQASSSSSTAAAAPPPPPPLLLQDTHGSQEARAAVYLADGAETRGRFEEGTTSILTEDEKRAARAAGVAAADAAKGELVKFNQAAEALFSRLGVLSCPKCADDRRRAVKAKAEVVPEPRVFGNGAALVAHMKTCCPRDVPDGDLVHLERMEGPDALMSLIATKRERERKRVAKVRAVMREQMQHNALEKAKLLDDEGGFLESRAAMMGGDGVLDEREEAVARTLAEVDVEFEKRWATMDELEKGDNLDDASLKRREGATCHICGLQVISADSLQFHVRACMQAWDNRERTGREPHRRRLFTWRKDDPQSWWDAGEAYSLRNPDRPGRKQFTWDFPPAPHVADPSLLELVLNQNNATVAPPPEGATRIGPYKFQPPFATNLELLRRPRLKRVPGPVPAPPRRHSLPSDVAQATGGEDDRAYNRRVGLYNAEAARIAEDWLPQCVNFRPVALVIRGAAALEKILEAHGDDDDGLAEGEGDGFSDGKNVLKLLGFSLSNDAALTVQSFAANAAVVDRVVDRVVAAAAPAADAAKSTIEAGDKLWTVSFMSERQRRAVYPAESAEEMLHKKEEPPQRPNWATWRFHTTGEEETGDLLAAAARDALRAMTNKDRGDADNESSEEPTLVLVFRRGCDKTFAVQSKLEKHMEGCCPEALALLKKADRDVPDPRADAPVNPDDLPGIVCFVCSKRVQNMGSLARHTARCFLKTDAFEAVKPKSLQEPPPRPPEHVYGRAQEKVVKLPKQQQKFSAVAVSGASDAQAVDLTAAAHETRNAYALQLRQDAAMRVTVSRYKDGHTFESSLQEWKYDVFFNFTAVLHVSSPDGAAALREAFTGVTLRRARPSLGIAKNRTPEARVEDGAGSASAEESWVLVVERCGGSRQHREHPSLPLCPGDEIVVTAPVHDAASAAVKDRDGVKDGLTVERVAAELLDVRWGKSPGAAAGCGEAVSTRRARLALQGAAGAAGHDDADDLLLEAEGAAANGEEEKAGEEYDEGIAEQFSGEAPFTVRVRRPLTGGLDDKALMPCMRLALAEWDRRCGAVFQNKQPRCGKRIALQRTLMETQLDDIEFRFTPRGGLEVKEFLEDDEGALLPGDELSVYGAPGAVGPQLKLAHGVDPHVLRQQLVHICRLDAGERSLPAGEGEVTLHLVRTILRPAHSVAAKGNKEVAKWAEDLGYSGKLKGELDGMKAGEIREKLLALKACGLDIQVEDGEDRVSMRGKLQEALKGGCGRVFGNQISVFKHMCQCCADVIDDATKELFAEDPTEAAARTLAVQSDAGLGGADLDEEKWPHGQPGWVCYLCNQRTFTYDSFKFHLRSCERNWDNNELQKHPMKRVPRPPPPNGSHGTEKTKKKNKSDNEDGLSFIDEGEDDGEEGPLLFDAVEDDDFDLIPDKYGPELKAYNDRAFEILAATQAGCPNCGLTFGSDDSLRRHMSQCCPAILEAEKQKMEAERDPIGKDTSIVCYLCGGRTVSLDSLPIHLRACKRAFYRREMDGKKPAERLFPPAPPQLPMPTTKEEIPDYNAQAQEIFNRSLPCCDNYCQFPLPASRTLIEALDGDGRDHAIDHDDDDKIQDDDDDDDDDDGLYSKSKQSSVAVSGERLLGVQNDRVTVVGKVPKDIKKATGIRRGDVLLCIQDDEPTEEDDGYRLVENMPSGWDDAQRARALEGVINRLSECMVASEQLVQHRKPPRFVWWLRQCGASFAMESKRDKHKPLCAKDLVKGLPGGLHGDGEEEAVGPGAPTMERDLSLYDSGAHNRVAVKGDVHSLHARGARERATADKQLAKENARIRRKLSATYKARNSNLDPETGKYILPPQQRIRSRLELHHWSEAKRVGSENVRLGHTMRWLYGRTSDPVDKAYGGVQDNAMRVTRYYEGYAAAKNRRSVLPAWDLRTQLYLDGDGYTNNDYYVPYGEPENGAPHKKRTIPPPKRHPPRSTTVPKTQGVTQCAGCGRRAFFRADGRPMRRCQQVKIEGLSEWTKAATISGERVGIACKLLGVSEEKPSFGGGCGTNGAGNGSGPVEGTGACDDCPWYCDDACALAGWMDHARVCSHNVKGNGNAGLAAVVDAPWMMRGNFLGGATGVARRFLNRQKVTVKYPSGQTEEIRDLALLEPPKPRQDEVVDEAELKKHWTPVEGLRARLKRFDARGRERLGGGKLVKVLTKPTVKELMEHLGKQVKTDPELMAAIGAADAEDEDEGGEQVGLACFFCGDKCNDMETYESHVKVCEMRWTRIESRKPSASRRRKPIRPDHPKPDTLADQDKVLAYNDAAKKAQGDDDGANPNGGGAIAATELLDKQADGRAAKEQLHIALRAMDEDVNKQIRDLEKLSKRIAWEKGGTGVVGDKNNRKVPVKKLKRAQGDGRGALNQPYPGDYDFELSEEVPALAGLIGAPRYDIGDARRRSGWVDAPPPPRHESDAKAIKRSVGGAAERESIRRPTAAASEIGRGVVATRGGLGGAAAKDYREAQRRRWQAAQEEAAVRSSLPISSDLGREIVAASGAAEREAASGNFPYGGPSREVPTLIGHRFNDAAPPSSLRPHSASSRSRSRSSGGAAATATAAFDSTAVAMTIGAASSSSASTTMARSRSKKTKAEGAKGTVGTGEWGDEPAAAGGTRRRLY